MSQLKRVNSYVYTGKNVPVYAETNIWWKFLATYFNTNWVFLQMGCSSWVAHPHSEKLYQQDEWKEDFLKKRERKKNWANFIATFHEKILPWLTRVYFKCLLHGLLAQGADFFFLLIFTLQKFWFYHQNCNHVS